MDKLGLNEIREKFLSFFESKGHLRQPSAPLVPQGDASLLLINSGMAPLKPYFAGEVKPPSDRMTTCQKCIRTPDIDIVGRTSRHGTFFEMLGNFSFGDYFKKEACAWAWEFAVDELKLPKDKLYVSVYLEDDETWDIWTKDIGVDPSHMARLGKEDNFWEIGAGPCGPCSEIYFDRGVDESCENPDCGLGCDCDRYVEFWNLVFTQFNNDGKGNYTPLAQKNIDTGMGLERMACIMQSVDSIFEVDTIRSLLDHVAEIAGIRYGEDERADLSLRIITDHIRSTTVLVSDGVLPSNEGRGYVLRRLLRRAARHGKLLGISRPFLHEACLSFIKASGGAYPELIQKQDYIRKIIKSEEESFNKTIDNGLTILRQIIGGLIEKGAKSLNADEAFKLYDTYGFPVDLTLEILAENDMGLDMEGFNSLMSEQRERARAARSAMGDFGWTASDLGLDKNVSTVFTGYESESENAAVLALIVEGEQRSTVYQGEEVIVVLDKTPFYAESGGQAADFGTIENDEACLEITMVKKLGEDKYLHIGEVQRGSLSVNAKVRASIDLERRKAIMRAHSATHMLHSALRQVVGEHAEQAGSLVEPDRIRFDFTHFSALSAEEIGEINSLVNDMILDGLPVSAEEMPIEEAEKQGAIALFGEKYGDRVRVIKMGDRSTELCGGTHLPNTAMAGAFMISGESSIAAGVRRVEAIVGKAFIKELDKKTRIIRRVAETIKTKPEEIISRAEQYVRESRELRQSLDSLKGKLLVGDAERFLYAAKKIRGLNVVTTILQNMDGDMLRKMGDILRDKDEKVVAVLSTVSEGKIVFHASCGKKAVEAGIRAGDLIKAVTRITGGSGGGKPGSAMGGGNDILALDNALAVVDDFVAETLKADVAD